MGSCFTVFFPALVKLKVAIGLGKTYFFWHLHGDHYGYTCIFSTKWVAQKYQQIKCLPLNAVFPCYFWSVGPFWYMVYGIWNMVCGIWYENGIHSVFTNVSCVSTM